MSVFAFKECQDLLRQRLDDPVLDLFTRMTGVRLHALWHPPPTQRNQSDLGLPCPAARAKGDARPTDCRFCMEQRWRAACAAAVATGWSEFSGDCETQSVCACAGCLLEGARPLTLILQDRAAKPGPARQAAWADPADRGHSAAFGHAVGLLRLIQHDLDATWRAHLAECSLRDHLRQQRHLEAENLRLRQELHSRLADAASQPGALPSEDHAHQLVQAVFDYVHAHYQQPLSLKEVAQVLKLNPNYLSALFSKTTGINFHRYLEELRLAKAEGLLRDPSARVREVASAVGYPSSNHFRNVFKAREGLPPSVWRAAQRAR